ncbi:MAG: hypothetical protein LBH93_00415 [Chitinispirillales bacterium]|nr:hypothetical protein [Chitinispirillales bacterium]
MAEHYLEFVGARNQWESTPPGLSIKYDGGTTAWLWSDGRIVKFEGALPAFLIDGLLPLRYNATELRYESEDRALFAWFIARENIWKLSDSNEVTFAVRALWNGQGNVSWAGCYAPVAACQACRDLEVTKANATDLTAHVDNADAHVTNTERATWNAKQAAITGGASTIITADLAANRALVSNANGKVAASAVSNTELGYLSGVKSSIQAQINAAQVASDGYTVMLTKSSHVFPAGVSAATAGNTGAINIVAFKGGTQVAANITAIAGQVTGLTTSIANNNTLNASFTVTVTTSLTTAGGTLSISATVDGKDFQLRFSWALAKTGAAGAKGDSGADSSYLQRILDVTINQGGSYTIPDISTIAQGAVTLTTLKDGGPGKVDAYIGAYSAANYAQDFFASYVANSQMLGNTYSLTKIAASSIGPPTMRIDVRLYTLTLRIYKLM